MPAVHSLSRPQSWLSSAAAVMLAALLAAACGSSSSTTSSTSAGPARTGPASTAPPPYVNVGPDPSVSSKMVCGTEGQAAIAAFLNETTTKVTTPVWANHVYSCTYV